MKWLVNAIGVICNIAIRYLLSSPGRDAAQVHIFDRASFSLLGSLGQWVLHSKCFQVAWETSVLH